MNAVKRPKKPGMVPARRAGTFKAENASEVKTTLDEACPSRYYFATPSMARRPVPIRYYTL